MSNPDHSSSSGGQQNQQQQQQDRGHGAYQHHHHQLQPQQHGWQSAEFNMTTTPSVGRFSNDPSASLYMKGSSAKFEDNEGRKTMAPYSNHGQLSGLQQSASQQSTSADIVDLRTPAASESKSSKPTKSSSSKQR